MDVDEKSIKFYEKSMDVNERDERDKHGRYNLSTNAIRVSEISMAVITQAWM